MSDEIAVMNQGKLVEVGPAEQVYTSPKDEYTRPSSRPCRFPIPRRQRERKAERARLKLERTTGM